MEIHKKILSLTCGNPVYTKPYTGLQLYLESWKNLEFDYFEKKKEKPGILTIFTYSEVKFQFNSKNLSKKLKTFIIIKFFLLKKHI